MHEHGIGTKELDLVAPVELTVRELSPRALGGARFQRGRARAPTARVSVSLMKKWGNAIPMTQNPITLNGDDDGGEVSAWTPREWDPDGNPA